MPIETPPSGSGSGTVTSVTAADTSIVVGGTATDPTIATGTLDVIAADHPATADWGNNSHKITGVANGTAASDAAAFGQIPTSLPPNGAAGGHLGGNFPNPSLANGGIPFPVEVPVSNDFILSQFLSGTAAASTAVALSDMIACPIWIQTLTAKLVTIRCSTAAATAVCRLGVYTNTSRNQPGTLIADWGTVSFASTGDKTITISQAFTDGLFWLVGVTQVAAASKWSGFNDPGGVGPARVVSPTTATAGTNCWHVAGTAGALPASPTWAVETAPAGTIPTIVLTVQ